MGQLELWVIAPSRTHAEGGQEVPDLPLTDDEVIEALNSGPFEPIARDVGGGHLWHLLLMTRYEALAKRVARIAGMLKSRAELPATRLDVKEYEPDAKGETKEVTKSRSLAELAAKREWAK